MILSIQHLHPIRTALVGLLALAFFLAATSALAVESRGKELVGEDALLG